MYIHIYIYIYIYNCIHIYSSRSGREVGPAPAGPARRAASACAPACFSFSSFLLVPLCFFLLKVLLLLFVCFLFLSLSFLFVRLSFVFSFHCFFLFLYHSFSFFFFFFFVLNNISYLNSSANISLLYYTCNQHRSVSHNYTIHHNVANGSQ